MTGADTHRGCWRGPVDLQVSATVVKTPRWPPDSPITTFCPAKPAHLLAWHRKLALLQGSHRQSSFSARGAMSWAAAALPPPAALPPASIFLQSRCVRHLCNGLESGPLGQHLSAQLPQNHSALTRSRSRHTAPTLVLLRPSFRPLQPYTCGPKASADGIPGASVPGIRNGIFLQNCRVSLHEVSRSPGAGGQYLKPPVHSTQKRRQMGSKSELGLGGKGGGDSEGRGTPTDLVCAHLQEGRQSHLHTHESRALWVNCEQKQVAQPPTGPFCPINISKKSPPFADPIHK